jgi:hydrogenase maturation factor
MADCFAHHLNEVDAEIMSSARNSLHRPGISVVKPALMAAELGAHAMHDPTEGGLSTGLYELSSASGCVLSLEEDTVLWFEPGVALCRALGADPWGVLASGTLLAGFDEQTAPAAIETLGGSGFPARRIGVSAAGEGVLLSSGAALPRFERDEISRLLETSWPPRFAGSRSARLNSHGSTSIR